MKKVLLMIIAVSFLMLESCANKKEMELEKIIKEVEEQIIPLRKVAAEASWMVPLQVILQIFRGIQRPV